MTNCKQNKFPIWLIIFIIIAIIIALVIISLYCFKFSDWDFIKYNFEKLNFKEFIDSILSNEKSEWGVFGDYIGGILNPLFSLAALFAVLHTIKLQNKQISDTNKAVEKQQFENHFFQMLGLFNDVKREIVLIQIGNRIEGGTKNPDSICKGMELLIKLSRDLFTSNLYGLNDYDKVKHACHEFYKRFRSTFEHYFRTLDSLIKLVDNSNIENKEFYSNIVCVNLSDAEVNLLFYYCYFLDIEENDELLKLVKKYDLLKYFTDPKNHRKLLSN